MLSFGRVGGNFNPTDDGTEHELDLGVLVVLEEWLVKVATNVNVNLTKRQREDALHFLAAQIEDHLIGTQIGHTAIGGAVSGQTAASQPKPSGSGLSDASSMKPAKLSKEIIVLLQESLVACINQQASGKLNSDEATFCADIVLAKLQKSLNDLYSNPGEIGKRW